MPNLDSGTKVEVHPGEVLMVSAINFQGTREQDVHIFDVRTGRAVFATNNYFPGNQKSPWFVANNGVGDDVYLIVCSSKLTTPVGSEPWWIIPSTLVQTSRSDPNGPFLIATSKQATEVAAAAGYPSKHHTHHKKQQSEQTSNYSTVDFRYITQEEASVWNNTK